MAYAQWIQMIIESHVHSGKLSLQNAKVSWGKFHKVNDKNHEIPAKEIDGQIAERGHCVNVAACGWADSSFGTEGEYDVYDGETKVCHVYWNCPFSSEKNEFSITDSNLDYMVESRGVNTNGDAIGNVTLRIAKLPCSVIDE